MNSDSVKVGGVLVGVRGDVTATVAVGDGEVVEGWLCVDSSVRGGEFEENVFC